MTYAAVAVAFVHLLFSAKKMLIAFSKKLFFHFWDCTNTVLSTAEINGSNGR